MHIALTTLALLALLAFALFGAATFAHLEFWTKRLTLALDYSDLARLDTPDGAAIELRRVPIPEGVAKVDLPPVLLVHGLAANHRNQDVHPDYSLARHLAKLGRDVWLLRLRSGMPGAPRGTVHFDAMAEHDVPLAVSKVLERTAYPSLDYVGFSMGGMLLYAAIGRTVPEEAVRRVVIVGSPARLGLPGALGAIAKRLPRWLIPAAPFKLGARLVAFASEWVATPFHAIAMNPRNVAKGITRATLVNVIEDVPASLNADFAAMARRGGALTFHGEDVLPRLNTVSIPALFVAGDKDNIAPAKTVKLAFEAWAKDRPGVEKRFLLLGKSAGHEEHYGHGDMALGARVGLELFGDIASFLSAA